MQEHHHTSKHDALQCRHHCHKLQLEPGEVSFCPGQASLWVYCTKCPPDHHPINLPSGNNSPTTHLALALELLSLIHPGRYRGQKGDCVFSFILFLHHFDCGCLPTIQLLAGNFSLWSIPRRASAFLNQNQNSWEEISSHAKYYCSYWTTALS